MMEVNTALDGDVAVLHIVGRIDGTTTNRLDQAIATVMDGGNRRIIFDLTEVDYVSSAGLRTILMAAKRANAGGGCIALFGLQPAVEEIMTTSGFTSIVELCASESDARAQLQA